MPQQSCLLCPDPTTFRPAISSSGRSSHLKLLGLGLLAGLCGCNATRLVPPVAPVSPASSSSATVPSQPTLGYLWDPARAGLRPLMGTPGAVFLGSNTYAKGGFTAAIPCVKQGFALLTDAAGAISLIPLPSGPVTEIMGRLSSHQKIVLSPSCSSALVYAPDSSLAVLISGLPAAPSAQSVSLAKDIAGTAISDSGSILFASPRSGNAIAVQALAAGSKSAQLVSVMTHYGGMAFLPNADTALLADSGQNTVAMVSQASSAASSALVASASDGISRPVAIAGSSDGLTAIVLNAGNSSLLRIDLARTSAPVRIACKGSPTELLPLSGNAIFQLNEPSAGTVYAFDGDSQTQRIVFLPADIAATTSGTKR